MNIKIWQCLVVLIMASGCLETGANADAGTQTHLTELQWFPEFDGVKHSFTAHEAGRVSFSGGFSVGMWNDGYRPALSPSENDGSPRHDSVYFTTAINGELFNIVRYSLGSAREDWQHVSLGSPTGRIVVEDSVSQQGNPDSGKIGAVMSWSMDSIWVDLEKDDILEISYLNSNATGDIIRINNTLNISHKINATLATVPLQSYMVFNHDLPSNWETGDFELDAWAPNQGVQVSSSGGMSLEWASDKQGWLLLAPWMGGDYDVDYTYQGPNLGPTTFRSNGEDYGDREFSCYQNCEGLASGRIDGPLRFADGAKSGPGEWQLEIDPTTCQSQYELCYSIIQFLEFWTIDEEKTERVVGPAGL